MLKRSLLAMACAALLATPVTAPLAATIAPPATEAFFSNPQFSAAKLSPSGRYLAVRSGSPGKRQGLFVINLAESISTPVAHYSNIDIDYFEWVNDNRLVYDTRDDSLAPGDLKFAPGMYAVNRDGSGTLQLADRGYDAESSTGTHIKRQLLPSNTYLLEQDGAQKDDYIYAKQSRRTSGGEFQSWSLLRVNTVTGRSQGVAVPAYTDSILLDASGEPRVATAQDRDLKSVHYRDPASGEWRKLAEFPAYGKSPGSFEPIGVAGDGTLYVATGAQVGHRVVRSFDVKTGKLGDKPVIDLTDYDFTGRFVSGNGKLLGVHMLTDARSTHWWDKDMAALQDTIDKLLPGTVNEISVANRPETPWVVVKSWSDRQPVVFVLYNRDTQKISKLGEAHPAINPLAMGERSMIRYKARDGMSIPAWLTLPPGGKKTNLPLVVLVHGGPFVRGGEWNWDDEAQFLATRGYAVLQPEFRGSAGFGARHTMAGWKQWGLAMQDDLADGARALAAQGIADGGRVCIAGASYGGYAALMGVIKDGDLFKCAIDWAGVTDINLLYTGTWRIIGDLSEDWKQYGMPQLVGDQVKDADQLQATSPLVQAARVKRPVLLAYGTHDRRVPIVHGERFYKAVKAHNPDVEWVTYDGEGHGWSLPENRVDFWNRVEKFLDKHIGTASK
ncbi:prolyl oligopeptidase family serine peptidase [Duganella sp. FT92W]|uniref:Prolyl oligopeptidase family serine peptidase n=1 Tax=Pseudoduganella rivuli TaxID=2666085 RepID=A0A7X2LTM2_9BURK|nr:alpha/beta fold hydrolase [Pseudoduganella rivuli]MRV73456.1 prolyl oligopeptidase family serine peptidase [Pseudoduganella rivuli]